MGTRGDAWHGQEEGDPARGWPLSWAGTCDALGTVAMWILVETTTVVFFYQQSRTGKVFRPKKARTSLLK